MSFRLGLKSKIKLRGVHPDLVAVVERAIQVSAVDFTVLEGLRSVDRQRELVARGASKTMQSRHLSGHAVDLGALLSGSVSWHWSLYEHIAVAVQQAARELKVPIRWGGVWDRHLNELGNIHDECAAYVERRIAADKSVFTDGPHFELPAGEYP